MVGKTNYIRRITAKLKAGKYKQDESAWLNSFNPVTWRESLMSTIYLTAIAND